MYPGPKAANAPSGPAIAVPVRGLYVRTCPEVRDPTTTSALPSPVTSAAAKVSPAANAGPATANCATCAPVAPLNTRTTGPAVVTAEAITSARPSPFTSADATNTPPITPGPNAANDPSGPGIIAPVFPSRTRTMGPSPGPGATTTSG